MNKKNYPLRIVAAILIVYFLASQIVFAFRHPWLNETERFMYFWQSLTFQAVEDKNARPNR
jgi:hypothetical protein